MAVVKVLKQRMAAKFTLGLATATAILSFAMGYLTLRLERQHFEELMVQSVERMTDFLVRSTRYSMLRNDREALFHQIRDIGEEQGVRRVRIYSDQGQIRFSTEASETGRMVDKNAEACNVCHNGNVPPVTLRARDTSRFFQTADCDRFVGMIRPVENSRDCWEAACHAHKASTRVLGVVDIHLSLAAVDAQMRAHERNLFLSTAALTALIVLIAIFFFYRHVHQPVRELIRGTQVVAGGDLTFRIGAAADDELGRLAVSFNSMTEELARAQEQLKENARTLEIRVEQKSSQLEKTYATLIQSEKLASLGRLAAVVAHEVNNPLFGMLTYSRLSLKHLENGPPSPEKLAEVRESLRVIATESKRCGDIMRNLLSFARQGVHGGAQLKIEAADANAVFQRALKLVRHQLDLQQIRVEWRPDPDLPTVPCDEGQLQQALLVLLINAAEAMPNGGELRASSERTPDGAAVLFRVQDSGPGIPPEILPQIFEPFFTTKEDQHRTGLGLAVARSIIERHRGDIRVNSRPGEGAEFLVLLPLEAAAVTQGGES